MPSNITKDVGATGLNMTWGMVDADFLREWRGQEKVKRVQEMMANSAVIGGALRLAFELPILDITWEFISDNGEEDPRLELLNAALDNLTHSWLDHLQEALLMPFYGWSLFTITYERVNGRMLWRKFKMLGHDTIQSWLFDEDGGLAGVQQWPHLWQPPIPIERCLLYRFRKTKNNPEGESMLRPSWMSWYFAKNIMQVEAIGIERNLAGMPVITPPQNADMSPGSADQTLASSIVRNIRKDEQAGVVLPAPSGPDQHQRWVLELLSPGGSGQATETDMVINRYEKRMLMSALAQFLMLGQDSVGALATFEGGSDFFALALNATADNLAATFTKYAIPRLLALNGMTAEGLSLTHSPIDDMGVSAIGDLLQKVGNKLTWTPADEMWLRGLMRLPEKSAEEIEEEKALNIERALRAMQQAPLPERAAEQEQQTADLLAASPPPMTERDWRERAIRMALEEEFAAMEREILDELLD